MLESICHGLSLLPIFFQWLDIPSQIDRTFTLFPKWNNLIHNPLFQTTRSILLFKKTQWWRIHRYHEDWLEALPIRFLGTIRYMSLFGMIDWLKFHCLLKWSSSNESGWTVMGIFLLDIDFHQLRYDDVEAWWFKSSTDRGFWKMKHSSTNEILIVVPDSHSEWSQL